MIGKDNDFLNIDGVDCLYVGHKNGSACLTGDNDCRKTDALIANVANLYLYVIQLEFRVLA